jgi:hypothetical protein
MPASSRTICGDNEHAPGVKYSFMGFSYGFKNQRGAVTLSIARIQQIRKQQLGFATIAYPVWMLR